MIIEIILMLGLIFNAGYFNGCMDWIKFKSLDKYQWQNKWELDHEGKQIHPICTWYYFGLHKLEYEEKFPYSSTILVFLTDDWHFKKWQTFLCYEIIISVGFVYYEHLQWWCIPIGIVAAKIVRGFGFTLKYDKK